MTVLRGFIITIASGIAFGCFGAMAGYILGIVAPDYYRTVFQISPNAEVNFALAGLGLGVTQGCTAGIVVGLVIVASVAWFNSRIAMRGEMSQPVHNS